MLSPSDVSKEIIESYFRNDELKSKIVSHHIDSFNYFVNHGIKKIFQDNNPVRLSDFKNIPPGSQDIGKFLNSLYYEIYIGGKKGDLIKIENANVDMYPNDARLQNKTYAFSVKYGIEIYKIRSESVVQVPARRNARAPQRQQQQPHDNAIPIFTLREEDYILLGNFPLMLKSDKCLLNTKTRQECYTFYQECRNDFGGYFIVDGKEKIIVCQDEANKNMIQIENLNEEAKLNDAEMEMDANLHMFDEADRETAKTNYIFSATVFSQSSNASKIARKLKIYMIEPVVSTDYKTHMHGEIKVDIVYFKNKSAAIEKVEPIPLFILMRALGLTSDESIIEACLIDMKKYSKYVDYFAPSVYDAKCCYSQSDALNYIKPFTKYNTIENVAHVFMYDLLPHLDDTENPDETNFLKKAMYIGYMVKQLLLAKESKSTQIGKDNYIMKRVLLTGTLLYDLFAGFYKKQILQIRQMFEYKIKPPAGVIEVEGVPLGAEREEGEEGEELPEAVVEEDDDTPAETVIQYPFDRLFDVESYRGTSRDQQEADRLFSIKVGLTSTKWFETEASLSKRKVTRENLNIHNGILSAFHGKWGYDDYSSKDGIVQTLERLSWNKFMSQLKRVNTPVAEKIKSNTVPPHLLHATHYGYIDPVDTPDGSEIGINKHLTIMAEISPFDSFNYTQEVKTQIYNLTLIRELIGEKRVIFFDKYMYPMFKELRKIATKLFINGNWVSVIHFPTSTRPAQEGEEEITPMHIVEAIKSMKRKQMNSLKYMSVSFDYNNNEIHIHTSPGRLCRPLFYNRKRYRNEFSCEGYDDKLEVRWNNGVGTREEANVGDLIEYLDPIQENVSLILSADVDKSSLTSGDYYTHMEIDPTLLFGVMGNQIVFPEHNQLPRNIFSCGQSTQTSSLYHSNYQYRFDKMGIVLNYGQIPLIKTKYLKVINHEEQPYGLNAIVAIMCYSGYNVEDAVLINKGAVDRGLFRISYFSSYEHVCYNTATIRMDIARPTKEQFKHLSVDSAIKYKNIGPDGMIKMGSEVDEDSILMSIRVMNTVTKEVTFKEIYPKMGQTGHVNKIGIFYGPDNCMIGRVKICQDRKPQFGDKFSSRHGQKGTIGLLVPEADMPYTKEGLRPDIIINPHAIPSRMTIGQLLESVRGILSLELGSYCDGTAFRNKDSKNVMCSNLLLANHFSAYGEDVLYNGFSGEQIKTNIFIGPTYYMRLKHMTRDKVQSRSSKKLNSSLQVDQLTKQPTHGRSTGGGQKIGEMETIAVVAHGISNFLKESFTTKSDAESYAICNKSGELAIQCNKRNPYLFSNSVDGPIEITATTSDEISSATEIRSKNSTDGILVRSSTHGRSFSTVNISTSLKVLIQELKSINVCSRIITEDNFPQMDTLAPAASAARRIVSRKEPQSQNSIPTFKNDNVLKNFANSTREYIIYMLEGTKETRSANLKVILKQCDLFLTYYYRLTSELINAEDNDFQSFCTSLIDNPTAIERYYSRYIRSVYGASGGGALVEPQLEAKPEEESKAEEEPKPEEQPAVTKSEEKPEEELKPEEEPTVTKSDEPKPEEAPKPEEEATITKTKEEPTISLDETPVLSIIDEETQIKQGTQNNHVAYPDWFEKLSEVNKSKILSYSPSIQKSLLDKIEIKLTQVDDSISSDLDIFKPSQATDPEEAKETSDIKQINI
jgi:DNA-directed RNA polymerase beta subunit